MTLLLLWIVLAVAVFISEKTVFSCLFAMISLAFVAAVLLLPVGDLQRATLLASIFAALVVGASAVKHHHSGLKLAASDLALTFSGTLPFMLKQYRQTAIMAIIVLLLLIASAILSILYGAGTPVAPVQRLLILGFAALGYISMYRLSGGADHFRPLLVVPSGYFSSFMASLIDIASWWRSSALGFHDIADSGLDISEPGAIDAYSARKLRRPDMIVIQHESLFDPRVFGLPVESDIQNFFTPLGAPGGTLNVEIYGGGSWQTEFSMLTGLSSRSFGPDSYFLFKKGAGRFHHSLPQALANIGYRTMVIAGCRRNFMNYDAFYESVGVTDRIFTEDLPPPFDIGHYEETGSDAMFLDAARAVFEKRVDHDPSPRLLIVLTNFNHGPHDQRQVPLGHFETERAFALNAVADAQYGEYYARLAETTASWNEMKSALGTRFPQREILTLRYGDHQPVMTRRIERALALPGSGNRHLKTFYALEGINMRPHPISLAPDSALDIAFLGTVALQAAGLPLDPVFAARASLMPECGEAYFSSGSERKRQLHRSLVDLGLVDCTPNRRASRRRN